MSDTYNMFFYNAFFVGEKQVAVGLAVKLDIGIDIVAISYAKL